MIENFLLSCDQETPPAEVRGPPYFLSASLCCALPRPVPCPTLFGLRVVLLLILVAGAAAAAERVILHAVGRQLDLHDGRIGRVLLGLLEVLRIHHEQVEIARVDDRLLVGRHARPVRSRFFRLVLVVQHGRLRREVVLDPPRGVAHAGVGALAAGPAALLLLLTAAAAAATALPPPPPRP